MIPVLYAGLYRWSGGCSKDRQFASPTSTVNPGGAMRVSAIEEEVKIKISTAQSAIERLAFALLRVELLDGV